MPNSTTTLNASPLIGTARLEMTTTKGRIILELSPWTADMYGEHANEAFGVGKPATVTLQGTLTRFSDIPAAPSETSSTS